MVKELYGLWDLGGSYRDWWRKMVDAYGESDAVKLLEWFWYEKSATGTQHGKVIDTVTDFLHDVDAIKSWRS
jgi:hypothetical protein